MSAKSKQRQAFRDAQKVGGVKPPNLAGKALEEMQTRQSIQAATSAALVKGHTPVVCAESDGATTEEIALATGMTALDVIALLHRAGLTPLSYRSNKARSAVWNLKGVNAAYTPRGKRVVFIVPLKAGEAAAMLPASE